MPERLEDSIRATAPAPDDDFLARLDARVDAGFAKDRTPGRTPAKRRRVPWLLQPAGGLVVVILMSVLVGFGTLAAVMGGGDDDESASSSSGGGGVAMEAAPETSEESSGGSGASSSAVAPGERRVVERRTSLDLRTPEDDFAETTAGVLEVADRTGTIVQASDVSQRDGKGFATYDLRVPSSRLDEALAALSRLGDVRNRSASSQDITASAVSTADRLQDAQDRRAALLRALAAADTEAERSSIERRLRSARRTIAQAQASVRRIRARADRAQVAVTVESTGEQGTWTPADALDDAGRILQVIAGVLLVAGAVLLPLGLVLAALLGASRLTKRRRREAVLG
ncbi:MAG TPA: DUF4349 domain-containing protein [Solirubrobacteraceae bacterium]|nr:DUF4349 domain-containing protein [Solirubrobacteraceae bacterium]